VDQVEPLLMGDEADAVAEAMLARPLDPQRRGFLGDDERLAWSDGQAAKRATGEAQAQQDAPQRGLA
jgi:hypothetical protein